MEVTFAVVSVILAALHTCGGADEKLLEFGDNHEEAHHRLLSQPNYECMLGCVTSPPTTAPPPTTPKTPPKEKVVETDDMDFVQCSQQKPREMTEYCQKKVRGSPLVQTAHFRVFFSGGLQLGWHAALRWCRSRGMRLGSLGTVAREREVASLLALQQPGVVTWLGVLGRSPLSWVDSGLAVTDPRAKLTTVKVKKPVNCLVASRWTLEKGAWLWDSCDKPKSFFCDPPETCYTQQCACACFGPQCPEFTCLPEEALTCCTSSLELEPPSKCERTEVTIEELTTVARLYVTYGTGRNLTGNVTTGNVTNGNTTTGNANTGKVTTITDDVDGNTDDVITGNATARKVNTGNVTRNVTIGRMTSFKDSGYNFRKLLSSASGEVIPAALTAHVTGLVDFDLRPAVALAVNKCTDSVRANFANETLDVFEGRVSPRSFLALMCLRKNLLLMCPENLRNNDPKEFAKCQASVERADVFPDVVKKEPAKKVQVQDFSHIPMEWYELGGRNYFFNRKIEGTWAQAVSLCTKYNLSIVSLETKEEDDLVGSKIGMNENFWIGANDLKSEGRFVWKASKLPLTYSNWYLGEPDNGGGSNHPTNNCVILGYWPQRQRSTWMDVRCDVTYYMSICEQL